MQQQGIRGLRPEEIAFCILFGMVAALHLFLNVAYAPWMWLCRQFAEVGMLAPALSGILILLVVGFAVVSLSRTLRGAVSAVMRTARNFLPFILMPLVYESLHSLGPRLHGRVYDLVLMRVDDLLFRSVVFWDVPRNLMNYAPGTVLTGMFTFCYGAVFIVYWGLAIYFYNCNDQRVFRKYMLSIVVTSMIGYVSYVFVPAVGPYEGLIRPGVMVWSDSMHVGNFRMITFLAEQIRSLHFDKTPASDAFPSLHTAWAIVVLGYAARYLPRTLWILGPWAAAMVIGSLFLQQHYLIDVVCALPAAVAGCIAANRLVDQRFEWSRTEVEFSVKHLVDA